MSFYNELSWSLVDGTGEHTVMAELRTSTTSATTSDTIWLEEELPPYPPPGDLKLQFLPFLKR
jgi:hypothetical protein